MVKGKRKRIGVLFTLKSRWLGGLYYLLNVIKSLEYLDEESQPDVVCFYNSRTEAFLKQLSYPRIKYVRIDIDDSLAGFFRSFILRKNFMFSPDFLKHDLDAIFPFNDFVGKLPRKTPLLVSWIPDFQHKYYPENFSKLNLLLREIKFKRILSHAGGLVLSSNDALSQFNKFYRPPKKFNASVVQFTSIIDLTTINEEKTICKLYSITKPYFIVCNQFYKHKNHLLVLKAIKLLKEKGQDYNVIFTGKPNQLKDHALLDEMEAFINNNYLGDQIKMLGLLSREDQLSLMNYSEAVIQPSKFEGWSTVIEDAKTLNSFVIASNLDVHQEQLGDKAIFFNPNSESDLAEAIESFQKRKLNNPVRWESQELRTKKFAKDFIAALS